ncbi:MAG: phosphoenolpyruvate synthase [Acidimicrobiales bacterium]|nr:phosphoenolpyruvate synthase [Acidimicrobiales bacterium]
MRTYWTNAAGATVLTLRDVDRTSVARVGGKGANLGELSRIDGIDVPAGFCVTTEAFRRIVAAAPFIDVLLDRLSNLAPDDPVAVRALSAEIRDAIVAVEIPSGMDAAIAEAVAELGINAAYAVRSSATSEDSPTASFAGQQDSYLNVVGLQQILRHVSRCWASLFTERAVTYRMRRGIDPRTAEMAVVVQRMVFPDAAGIMFTADPITSNRRIAVIEAGYGLGEALVSGLVDADVFVVRDGEIITTTIGRKQLEIRESPSGGTEHRAVELHRQAQPSLTGAQVRRLAQLGRRIETHFGCPQDIEWCSVGDVLHIVQTRPITTLFPIPSSADGANHVYVSVGHQQMMTDPMKPLGLSLWQSIAMIPMHAAAGRLFVDVTARLASPATRSAVIDGLGTSDPLIGDALRAVVDRADFIEERPDDVRGAPAPGTAPTPIPTDPGIVSALRDRTEASIAEARRSIRGRTGEALLDFIVADVQELKHVLTDPQSMQVIVAGMDATAWLNEQLQAWLGEKNAADALARSVPGNVTSEMGLALLDVADAVRPHPEVVAFLRDVRDGRDVHGDGFLDQLPMLAGGTQARNSVLGYLDVYGMRCVGEIDITRPRWSERPTTLVPLILGNVENFAAGEAERRFAEGQRAAARKEEEILQHLRALPDGARKAEQAKRMIDRIRTFIGYREHPKYGIVCRTFLYKQALMAEADRLVAAGIVGEAEDIFLLTLQELHEVVRTGARVDDELIRRRTAEHASYQALTPPRVLTSDGEVVAGSYRRGDLPAGALAGLPVSAGTVEGRARIILDIADADLEPGDILVTAYTDPSWSPLFVAIAGLVTEVGGLMTHGAVIAREYGLPAVVGVEHATRLIQNGQRIRVNGTDGFVEILTTGLMVQAVEVEQGEQTPTGEEA